MTPVELPVLSATQEACWLGLLDLAEKHLDGWTLIGGQMVHLLCAERGVEPYRSTPDVDTVLAFVRSPKCL